MAYQPAGLIPERWLALDAGATRIRVAPVVISETGPVLAEPPTIETFAGADGPSRLEQAADLLRRVGQGYWDGGPYRLGLAWAGAPSADGRGIVRARYGPILPDLVQGLQERLPLAHAPVLHSDGRAALEGAMFRHPGQSGYALISGTGLGEAYFAQGQSISRDELAARWGSASEWIWEGRDAEAWLRAAAWKPAPGAEHVRSLQALLSHRLQQFPVDRVWLGGHFLDWFENGWLEIRPEWPQPQPLSPEATLPGAVIMERRRLTSMTKKNA